MAKYDVYTLADRTSLVLDVQADLLEGLNSRIVVPLMALSEAPKPAKLLNPVFEIEGKPHVMATQFMASVPCSLLKKPLDNLSAEFDKITDALDMVFQGF